MAKEIIDIYVEKGYRYEYAIDLNDVSNNDIEGDYDCYFENEYVGKKQFTNISDEYYILELLSTDTGKITKNLSEYVVYVIEKASGKPDKLLTGRIVLDKQIRVV